MTMAKIPGRAMHDKRLGGVDYRILLALDNVSHISLVVRGIRETLAANICCHAKTVSRSLKRLEEWGYLSACEGEYTVIFEQWNVEKVEKPSGFLESERLLARIHPSEGQ